jgi:regulatory protein
MHQQGRITAIVTSERHAQRASIVVDGRRKATLSRNRIAELGLAVGQLWDEHLAQAVAEATVYDKALKQATNRLARRAMSRSQLQHKLSDLGYEQAVCERVLARVEELGLLNDAAYAEAVVREALARKPAGARLLKQKLAQKGVERAVADRVVAQAMETVDQTSAAADLARKRLRQMHRLDDATKKRRLFGLLARRGFDYETIDAALRSIADD